MILNLKPYVSYKDSGVNWLGDVPEHWDVLPNRALFKEVKDRNHPDDEMLSVTITSGVVRQRELLADSTKKDSSNLDKTAYKLVAPGDIVYNKMRAWQGAIGVSLYRGIVSPAYVVVRPQNKCYPSYFHYLWRTPHFAKEAERWSYGITSDMWSLRPEHFKLIYSCLPPKEEQEQIVRFLDYMDRRIRRYIRAKQKLIKLLEEQKQVIINQAVTRGLDPKVRMKPSGVEWLGDIPVHWKVRKLKYEMTLSGGGTPSKGNPSYWSGTIPWISPKDMKAEIINDAEDHITEQAVLESSTRLVEKGSILLVVRSGILQRTIPVALSGCDVAINQDMKALNSKGRLEPGYFVALVRGCEKALLIEWTKQGATVESIEHQYLVNTEIPVPPFKEQQDIIRYIRNGTVDDNHAIATAQREIELLREYRTRLIADAVTGKLDLRYVAAQLPDEFEDADILDEDEITSDDETQDDSEDSVAGAES